MTPVIILTATHCEIPNSEAAEHDGIMEQVTYELNPKGVSHIPWRYVETHCRL